MRAGRLVSSGLQGGMVCAHDDLIRQIWVEPARSTAAGCVLTLPLANQRIPFHSKLRH